MNDFLRPVAAIFIGCVLGFTASRLILQQMSSHAFNNCSDGKLEFAQDSLMGDHYYCIK